MQRFGCVTSTDKPQIELGCSKNHMTDSSTLLALESQLRASIQDVLGESDLVYSPLFKVNLWFEEEERQCDKIVKERRTQESGRITASLKNKYQSNNENIARIITSLDPVSRPPCPRALDAPLTVATVQLCASLQKQQAALRGHLSYAVLKHIRSVSRDNQRLAGALQKCIRSSNFSHVPTSGDNTSTFSGGGGAPPVVGDVELMIHGIREERKASENTGKRLKAAVGGWRSARF